MANTEPTATEKSKHALNKSANTRSSIFITVSFFINTLLMLEIYTAKRIYHKYNSIQAKKQSF